MMIFLEVLKWIGIVLLVILALVITLLIIFLFVPVRYHITSEGKGRDIKAIVKIGWMSPFLTLRYDFNLQEKKDEPLSIRVFGIKIGRRKKED